MMRSFLTTAALAVTLALPVHAFDLSTMSDAERAQFRAEIRAYLLENPEVIMEAVAVLEERQQAERAQADVDLVAANAAALFEDGHSWVGGNPEGDLTLVEFIDYRCGYCRRAFDEVTELVESDGNIRFIVKEYPILGQESELSSRFAIATLQLLGEDAYKQVHDALITYKGGVNDASLSRIAENLGFDPAPLLARMTSQEVTDVIAANRELAGRMNINGTPSFVMGDRMLRGYMPLDGMRNLVDQARG